MEKSEKQKKRDIACQENLSRKKVVAAMNFTDAANKFAPPARADQPPLLNQTAINIKANAGNEYSNI